MSCLFYNSVHSSPFLVVGRVCYVGSWITAHLLVSVQHPLGLKIFENMPTVLCISCTLLVFSLFFLFWFLLSISISISNFRRTVGFIPSHNDEWFKSFDILFFRHIYTYRELQIIFDSYIFWRRLHWSRRVQVATREVGCANSFLRELLLPPAGTAVLCHVRKELEATAGPPGLD